MMDRKERIKSIVSDISNVHRTDFDDSVKILEIENWDSMSHMLLISRIEETFGLTLSSSEILGMITIDDIDNIVLKKNGFL